MQKQFDGQNIILLTNDAGITGHPHAKEKRPKLHIFYKDKLKWNIALNVEHRTIQLSGENMILN